jgi:hypothetical protein
MILAILSPVVVGSILRGRDMWKKEPKSYGFD